MKPNLETINFAAPYNNVGYVTQAIWFKVRKAFVPRDIIRQTLHTHIHENLINK